MERRIVIGVAGKGVRLDHALAEALGMSRAHARRLIAGGSVRRNGRPVSKGETLATNDVLTLPEALLDVSVVADPELPLMVRYQDEHLVVVEKPSGIPSHPLDPGERGCLANALLAQFPEMAHLGYDKRQAGLVNRLDNDTSGLVLAARTALAWTELRELLQRGGIAKRYLALTSRPVPLGMVTLWLAPRGAHVVVVASNSTDGVATQSRVAGCTTLRDERYLVEVEASHAYRHQVRVHLAELGAPIVGDALYGGAAGPHHYLHASRMSFSHPFGGGLVDVASPLPAYWDLA